MPIIPYINREKKNSDFRKEETAVAQSHFYSGGLDRSASDIELEDRNQARKELLL